MKHITINVVRQNEIEIIVGESGIQYAEAFLLGKSGEELQQFALYGGANKLKLNSIEAGTYSLRIDTGKEVIVKQIKVNL